MTTSANEFHRWNMQTVKFASDPPSTIMIFGLHLITFKGSIEQRPQSNKSERVKSGSRN